MDVFLKQMAQDNNIVAAITTIDIVLALVSSTFYSFLLSKVYIHTHSGHSYSRSFVHSMVLVSITIALIMIIIGSNIARAFALVGAMSIVRFRNPVKDSRDLVFVFMAIAIGMACGTQFYSFAAIFTAFVLLVLLVLHYTGYGTAHANSWILTIKAPANSQTEIETVMQEHCRHQFIVSVDKFAGMADMQDMIFEVELKRGAKYAELIDSLTRVSDRLSVSVMMGESNINV